MKLNRKSIAVGLVAGALAGGAGGALAASGGGTPTATEPATPLVAHGWHHAFFGLHDGMSHGAMLPAAASYLGLSQSALQAQLQSGKTLAQIAGAQHKSVTGLENAMVAACANRINSDSSLTSAQKAALIAHLKAHVNDIVNGTDGDGFAASM